MKKILIAFGSVVLAALLFIGGVYASDLLKFTGDSQIEQAGNDVDEIMQILRDMNQDKLSTEDALAKLQELNPEQLIKEIEQLKTDKGVLETELANKRQEIENKNAEIQEKIEEGNRKVAEKQTELDGVARERDTYKQERDALQQQVNKNNEYVQHLERELTRANEKVQAIGSKTTKAVEEARTYKDGE